uniref:Uncharacterized protein n=1 Tax=Arundo donax TaxID=35708 RepID=A0A0A8YSQ7_ARUDO
MFISCIVNSVAAIVNCSSVEDNLF